jgi:GNAT superfamily N-acetyltransferase
LEIVKAVPAEAGTVLSILREVAEWLRARGIQQWTHYLVPEAGADVDRAVERGEVYVARQDGRILGTMALLPSPGEWDRQIWGEVGEHEAIYVHRLAVVRSAAGAGMGDRLLDFAEAYARAAGKRYLRLDCVSHNERLNAYYARRYQLRGQAPALERGMTMSLYEKDLNA